MRKLKLQVQISIDGFITGTEHQMDWMTYPWSNDIMKYVASITEPVDTLLLGKNLATGFIPHWASNPEGEDPKFVAMMNNTKKIVFTKTLKNSEWPNTTLAHGDLVEEVKKLKSLNGKDMIVYGGATFVASLIKENLIDEYHLFVNPAAIGKGLPIFNLLQSNKNFKLVKAQGFDCGIVLLNYIPQ